MRGNLKSHNRSNITISTDSEIFDAIRKDCQSKGITLNAQINQILKKHILFYRLVEEKRGVILPHQFMAGLVDMCNENQFINLLDEAGGNKTVPTHFAHNGIPYTMENLIKYFFEGISLWAGAYNKFRYRGDVNNNLSLIMEHDFGIKYSRMLGEVISRFINRTLHIATNFEALPTTIIIHVDNK